MNAEWYWHKNRFVVLCNIIEGPDIDIHIHTYKHLIVFIKQPVIYTGKTIVSSPTNAGCLHVE